jgi:hypothetical protein
MHLMKKYLNCESVHIMVGYKTMRLILITERLKQLIRRIVKRYGGPSVIRTPDPLIKSELTVSV